MLTNCWFVTSEYNSYLFYTVDFISRLNNRNLKHFVLSDVGITERTKLRKQSKFSYSSITLRTFGDRLVISSPRTIEPVYIVIVTSDLGHWSLSGIFKDWPSFIQFPNKKKNRATGRLFSL